MFKCRNIFAIVLISSSCLLAGFKAEECEPSYKRTAEIASWEKLRYGMFICWGMNTLTGQEYDEGREPVSAYNPEHVDVRQWVRVAKEAGMNYAVLTAKHMAGFCLWDSNNYDYDVAASPNKTDVVAEYMAACKEYDIAPGMYYCIIDPHNEGKVSWNGPVSDDYFRLIKQHITELHTRYPGIVEQWIDIVIGKLNTEQRCELYATIKKLNPKCLVLMNQAFKDGSYIDPNVWPTDIVDGERTYPQLPRHNPVKQINGKKYYIPMETCDTLSQYWFGIEGDRPKAVRTLYKAYCDSVGRGANLLLNVPPDKKGRIPQCYIDRLMELKKVISNPSLLPAPPLSYNARVTASNTLDSRPEYGAGFAVDDDPETRWTTDPGTRSAVLELDLGKVMNFNSIKIQEPFEKRIKSFQVLTKSDSGWKTILQGNSVGNNYEIELPSRIQARFVRLEITDADPNTLTKRNILAKPGQVGVFEGPSISEFTISNKN